MRIIVTKQNIGLWAATFIRYRVLKATNKPYFVLGLPTGGTVVEMYDHLCQFYQAKKLDFSKIITFNMDEYVGVPTVHPQSYHTYMQQHLFSIVNIPPKNIHFLNGNAINLQTECANYEKALASYGGVDLFVGGIGENGHIAFNEPGSDFHLKTHLVTLTQNTRQANARFFDNDIAQVPKQALSVGISTILDARELLFLATGTKKAQAIFNLLNFPPSKAYPLTALKTHSNATLLANLEACQQLPSVYKENLLNQMKKFPLATHWILNVKETL